MDTPATPALLPDQAQATANTGASLDLAANPDSQEFAQQLHDIRQSFASAGRTRTEFVHLVCDELIARGVAPNTSNIQRLAKWGTSSAMAADVHDWYLQFSARLRADQPQIPAVMRMDANRMLEQMWRMANTHAGGPLLAQIEALKADLAKRAERESALLRAQTELQGEISRHLASIDEHKLTESGLRRELLAMQQLAEKERQAAREELHNKEQACTQALARMDGELTAERQARALAASEHASAQAANKVAHEAVSASLNASLKRLEDLVDSTRRDAARQVDTARQDAKEAHGRAAAAESRTDEARAMERQLREQLASIELKLQQANTSHQTQSIAIEDLQTKLQAAQAAVKIRSSNASRTKK